VAADGVTLEPTWLGWLERAADGSAQVGGDEQRFVAGDAQLYGEHVVARHGCGEHGAFPGVRVPLLDTPLVEFVGALTGRHTAPGRNLEGIACCGDWRLLPQEVLAQKKRTFTLPWEDWLRGGLRKRLETSLRKWRRDWRGIFGQTECARCGALS